uniref:Uncharacterized protein n=1 Tax=Arundo donax TaxID=35708 RepID=A0A0A9DV02_ARUDO
MQWLIANWILNARQISCHHFNLNKSQGSFKIPTTTKEVQLQKRLKAKAGKSESTKSSIHTMSLDSSPPSILPMGTPKEICGCKNFSHVKIFSSSLQAT